MKISKNIIFFLFLILNNFCFATAPKFTKGKLLKGEIDGCTWLIELQDKKILQPSNITKFNIKLKDGKRIRFKYKSLKNVAGFCMMGDMVEITEIKK
jgi:hypothetical protein